MSLEYKIALTYAPSEQQFLPVPPLGISVLSQYLIEKGIENDIIDLELELWLKLGYQSSEYASKPINKLNIDELPVDDLVELLLDYDIVTFSIMGNRQLYYTLAILKKLKKHRFKRQYYILGGAFFNAENSQEFISTWHNYIDYIIVDEGWHPLYEIIRSIKAESSILDTPGVVHVDNFNNVKYYKSETWKKDIPIPNYKKINKCGYLKQQQVLYGIDDTNIIYHIIVGDRKCPYNCSFCRISDNTQTIKTPTQIVDEMIEINKVTEASCFSLICNEMNPTEEYFCEFVDRLLSCEKNFTWFCYLRPNKLGETMLKKAKNAGCILVRYGVESGSQKVLDHMNKALYVPEIEQIMQDTSKAGIWNHINIMTGYLHEKQTDIQLTLDFIERNNNYIDSIRVNPFYIPLNSPIHKNPSKFGISLRENTGSYLQFDEPNCLWEEKQIHIQQATQLVLQKCVDVGINFAGILPFFVAKIIDYFGNVKTAKKWIEKNHNYLSTPISPDTAKWQLAHPEKKDIQVNLWKDISGKRGHNYQSNINIKNEEENNH